MNIDIKYFISIFTYTWFGPKYTYKRGFLLHAFHKAAMSHLCVCNFVLHVAENCTSHCFSASNKKLKYAIWFLPWIKFQRDFATIIWRIVIQETTLWCSDKKVYFLYSFLFAPVPDYFRIFFELETGIWFYSYSSNSNCNHFWCH